MAFGANAASRRLYPGQPLERVRHRLPVCVAGHGSNSTVASSIAGRTEEKLRRRRRETSRSKAGGTSLLEVLGAAGAVVSKQDWADIEAAWQSYIQSEEFLTFHAVVDSLLTLPPMSDLAEKRAEFELLVHLLHRLGVALNIEYVSKSYRAHYSPDVQLTGYLYSTLLTAFTLLPTYVLNGQEFYVSDTVLDQCQSLQEVFLETCKELKRQYENLQPYSLEQIRNDVKRSLVYFDRSWCRFEMPALEEIEAIHRQACRPLIEAIEVEKTLSESDGSQCSTINLARKVTSNGSQRTRFDVQRSRLMEKICELNRLANIEGKGRSDMDLTCVLEAEKMAAKPMCTRWSTNPKGEGGACSKIDGQNQSVRCCGGMCAPPVLLRISKTLIRAWERLRRVLRRYGRCLYQLNSHLANNPDLVRALELFESAWEAGNRYLVQSGPRRVALSTFEVIMGIKDQHFQSALASLDPGFLVATLPRYLLLNDMLRASSSERGSSITAGSIAIASKMNVKLLKASELPPALPPRPAAILGGPSRKAAPTSALQRSPLAKAYLPWELSSCYDDAVALLSSFSEAQLSKLRKQLLDVAGSRVCSGFAPNSLPRSPVAALRRTPGTAGRRSPGTVSMRCTTGGRQADRPPATPCPPRMAVPNSSRPTTSKDLALGNIVPLPSPAIQGSAPMPEEEEDEEDDVFCLDLVTLQEEVASTSFQVSVNLLLPDGPKTPLLHQGVPRRSIATSGSIASVGVAEEDERQVHATISTLALRLQREKPQEWNELIQVVLQGLALARGPTPSDKASKGCSNALST